MLTTVIEVAVILICVATACYLLSEFTRWISRRLRRRHQNNSHQEGPPDLFGGF